MTNSGAQVRFDVVRCGVSAAVRSKKVAVYSSAQEMALKTQCRAIFSICKFIHTEKILKFSVFFPTDVLSL